MWFDSHVCYEWEFITMQLFITIIWPITKVKTSRLGSLEYFFKGELGGKKVKYMLSSRNTLYFKVVFQSFPQLN